MIVMAFSASLAQNKGKDHEAMRKEVHEFKLKYLAQEMGLSSDQEKRFVEIYNQMSQEKRVISKEMRAQKRKLKEDKNLTDADYKAATKALADAKEKEVAIDKKYEEKFAKFLSSKQIFKMREAEEKFRAKMHEMRHSNKNKKK